MRGRKEQNSENLKIDRCSDPVSPINSYSLGLPVCNAWQALPSDSRLNTLDSKPTPLNCLGCERLTSKQVGYKKIHRSQFIDIDMYDKYTEFDPNMKINYKQIGCEISYG